MKLSEALALQEGDLVDVKRGLSWRGGELLFGCKVLIVSSKGGVFVTNQYSTRWVQYCYVVALGRREELTEKERACQRYEIERFQTKREQARQKDHEWWMRYLQRLRPQELYQFVWGELEDGEGRTLEVLQAKAAARGLRASATTWRRIGRKLGCDANPQFWQNPPLDTGSVIVLPRLSQSTKNTRENRLEVGFN